MLQGDLVLQQPWYNMSCQSPQPSFRLPTMSYNPFANAFLGIDKQAADQASLSASLCTDLAFQMGSCLQIQGTNVHSAARVGDAGGGGRGKGFVSGCSRTVVLHPQHHRQHMPSDECAHTARVGQAHNLHSVLSIQ